VNKIPLVLHLEEVPYKKCTRKSVDICKFCKYLHREGCTFVMAVNYVNYVARVS